VAVAVVPLFISTYLDQIVVDVPEVGEEVRDQDGTITVFLDMVLLALLTLVEVLVHAIRTQVAMVVVV
jgi:hypothetical protein